MAERNWLQAGLMAERNWLQTGLMAERDWLQTTGLMAERCWLQTGRRLVGRRVCKKGVYVSLNEGGPRIR